MKLILHIIITNLKMFIPKPLKSMKINFFLTKHLLPIHQSLALFPNCHLIIQNKNQDATNKWWRGCEEKGTLVYCW